MVVLDYVRQPADFPTMKARGVEGAVVYVAPQSWAWPKCITPAGLSQARAAGFSLAFNFEQNPGDYQGGTPRGASHGAAIGQALADLGLPASQSCYLSIDTLVPAAAYAVAAAYFEAAIAASGHPLDFYGQNDLGEYLVRKGLVKRLWMSESTSFPGNASPTPHVVLQQHYGQSVPGLSGSYDVNTVIQADWGQNAAPAPAPVLTKDDKLTYFYRVTDNPTVVSPNAIYVTDFIFTRHVGSPTALAQDQLWAAFEGAPHVEVHDMPYAFHQDLVPVPFAVSGGTSAPEPTHFVGTVDLKAAP